MRKLALIVTMAIVAGCFSHSTQRAENMSAGVGYQIALEKCIDQEITVRKLTKDKDKAMKEYMDCADAADVAFGRKK